MSVLVPPSRTASDAGSLGSIENQRAFYTGRLKAIRANIEHLEDRLRPEAGRFNPHLFEIWQGELVYWKQLEKEAAAKLEQLGTNPKDTEPHLL